MENFDKHENNSRRTNAKRTKEKTADPQKSPKSLGLSLSNFELGNTIADGSISTVVEARTVKWTTARENIPDKHVILKCIPKYRVTKKMRNFLHREIEVHMRVGSHPNISTMYGSFEDMNGIYLVIEKIRGPTLHELIGTYGKLSEKCTLQITDQILEGLSFMHSRGYAHRDLSSKNILFREWPVVELGKLHVMLVDMGDASYRPPIAIGGERCSSEKVGSLLFTAPEVHTDPFYLPESCDIWSIGVLMYLMISGKHPYRATTNEGMIKAIQENELVLEGGIWDDTTSKTKNIIQGLLATMPYTRPDVEKLKFNVGAALKGKFKGDVRSNKANVTEICRELEL